MILCGDVYLGVWNQESAWQQPSLPDLENGFTKLLFLVGCGIQFRNDKIELGVWCLFIATIIKVASNKIKCQKLFHLCWYECLVPTCTTCSTRYLLTDKRRQRLCEGWRSHTTPRHVATPAHTQRIVKVKCEMTCGGSLYLYRVRNRMLPMPAFQYPPARSPQRLQTSTSQITTPTSLPWNRIHFPMLDERKQADICLTVKTTELCSRQAALAWMMTRTKGGHISLIPNHNAITNNTEWGSTERSTIGKAHSDGIIMGITIDDEHSVAARPNGEVGSLDDDDDDVAFGAALDFNRSTPACSRWHGMFGKSFHTLMQFQKVVVQKLFPVASRGALMEKHRLKPTG